MANQVFTSLDDRTLIQLDAYAEHYGISRSAAVRYAVLRLLRGEQGTGLPPLEDVDETSAP